VFQRFRGARLKLNPDSWKLFQKGTVPGTCITGRSDCRSREAEDWTVLAAAEGQHELRSFFGLWICNRRPIAGLSDISKPLNDE
jgi:hypothetical protein